MDVSYEQGKWLFKVANNISFADMERKKREDIKIFLSSEESKGGIS